MRSKKSTSDNSVMYRDLQSRSQTPSTIRNLMVVFSSFQRISSLMTYVSWMPEPNSVVIALANVIPKHANACSTTITNQTPTVQNLTSTTAAPGRSSHICAPLLAKSSSRPHFSTGKLTPAKSCKFKNATHFVPARPPPAQTA